MSFLRTDKLVLDFPIRHLDERQAALAFDKSGRPSRFVKGPRGYYMRALDHIDLSLQAGDRLALIGANGAGKTSLLRVLAGIYPPTAGAVEASGRVSTMFTVGLGFDQRASGYENIYTTGLMLGLKPDEIREIVPDIERFTELGEFLSLPISSLSAGMQARLAFAVTTSVRPDILLIDEIVGAGDPAFMIRARDRLLDMTGAVEILVVASQSLDVLQTFCNQAILLVDGHVVEQGSVSNVFKAYAHKRGAEDKQPSARE